MSREDSLLPLLGLTKAFSHLNNLNVQQSQKGASS